MSWDCCCTFYRLYLFWMVVAISRSSSNQPIKQQPVCRKVVGNSSFYKGSTHRFWHWGKDTPALIHIHFRSITQPVKGHLWRWWKSCNFWKNKAVRQSSMNLRVGGSHPGPPPHTRPPWFLALLKGLPVYRNFPMGLIKYQLILLL